MEVRGTRLRVILFKSLLIAEFLVPMYPVVAVYSWYPLEDFEIKSKFREKDEEFLHAFQMKDTFCPLDVMGTHPYLVKIVDSKLPKFDKHGAIFTHLGVLSTVTPVNQDPKGAEFSKAEDVKVWSQRMYSVRKGHFYFCNQKRRVSKIVHHPKWKNSLYDFTYDYAIFILERQFEANNNFVYPVLPIHKSPYDFLEYIKRLLAVPTEFADCEAPTIITFNRLSDKSNTVVDAAYLHPSNQVHLITENKQCTEQHCNRFGVRYPECKEWRTKVSRNFDLICSKMDNYKNKTLDGVPLICNNSAVGLVSEPAVNKTETRRLIVASSFLMIWPWLMTYKDILWNRTYNRKEWDSVFIEDHKLYFDEINKPKYDKNVSVYKTRVKFFGYQGKWKHVSRGDRLEHSFEFHHTIIYLTTVFLFITYCCNC